MMDKSLPYYEVVMVRDDLVNYPEYLLPEGYEYHIYQPGDEKAWAEIETSVTEFDECKKAEEYFKNEFLCFPEEAKKRCIFVKNPEGELVATTSAWFGDDLGGIKQKLHWVAVKPEYQGKGLSKALLTKALDVLNDLHCDGKIYLTTQTWSYTAIGIYKKFGFKPYYGTFTEGSHYARPKEYLEKGWEIIDAKLNEYRGASIR